MSRALPASILAAILNKTIPLAFFVELQFSLGTVRYWTGYSTKTWDGQDWIGGGDFVGVTPVDETTEVGAAGLVFSMSGLPSANIAIALADNYRGRLSKMWLALLDSSEAVVDTYQIFGGRMDVMTIEEDPQNTSTIAVRAENRLIDLTRARATRYTDATQQRLFAGDLGFEYVAKLAERPLPWGIPGQFNGMPFSRGIGNGVEAQ